MQIAGSEIRRPIWVISVGVRACSPPDELQLAYVTILNRSYLLWGRLSTVSERHSLIAHYGVSIYATEIKVNPVALYSEQPYYLQYAATHDTSSQQRCVMMVRNTNIMLLIDAGTCRPSCMRWLYRLLATEQLLNTDLYLLTYALQ